MLNVGRGGGVAYNENYWFPQYFGDTLQRSKTKYDKLWPRTWIFNIFKKGVCARGCFCVCILLHKLLKFVSNPHYVATAICLADQRRPTQRGSFWLNAESGPPCDVICLYLYGKKKTRDFYCCTRASLSLNLCVESIAGKWLLLNREKERKDLWHYEGQSMLTFSRAPSCGINFSSRI